MAGDHDRHMRVMGIARREASALGHDYICTEHVLLALLRAPDEGASRVLLNLGILPEQIRKEIGHRVTKGSDTTPREQLPMTPWLQTALKLALVLVPLLSLIMAFFGAVALPLLGLNTARYRPPGTERMVQLP